MSSSGDARRQACGKISCLHPIRIGPEGRLEFRATMTAASKISLHSGLIGFGVNKGVLLQQSLPR
jgi:hypothetical protein